MTAPARVHSARTSSRQAAARCAALRARAAAAVMAPHQPAAAHGHFSEEPAPLRDLRRTVDFYGRVTKIYGSYKVTQLRDMFMRLQGVAPAQIKSELWDPQHTWAGQEMYQLAVSLRGFYLKAGQFIGARADFVPEQICSTLCLLQDRVPPMPPAQAARLIARELGVTRLDEVFQWIDLEQPLGSASISQVHKAQLRQFTPQQLRQFSRQEQGLTRHHVVQPGETAWSICNDAGISLAELAELNRGASMEELQPGDPLKLPVVLGLQHFSGDDPVTAADPRGSRGGPQGGWCSSSSGSGSGGDDGDLGGDAWLVSAAAGAAAAAHYSGRPPSAWLPAHSSSSGGGGGSAGDAPPLFPLARVFGGSDGGGSGWGAAAADDDDAAAAAAAAAASVSTPAAAAVAHAVASRHAPPGGLVAVKIQYPDALGMMSSDLKNLRAVCGFLSRTEIKFDLVSAVDELQKQIHLEFDFMREARVMDTIAQHLSGWRGRVAVPQSVPGLVTQRLMVMRFMEGLPLMQLKDKVAGLPQWQRDKAARRILSQLSEAYGRMILGEGLFQADGHPGNILVQKGGGIALLDYGQSKQLPREERLAFAKLVLALHSGATSEVDAALTGLGVVTSKPDPGLRCQMAYGMFDTRGTVDPFDPNSPIKQSAIQHFPPDMFFVLRVVQLLRGIANGMGITDFSTAAQWQPLAQEALRADRYRQRQRQRQQRAAAPPTLGSIASPLRLTV